MNRDNERQHQLNEGRRLSMPRKGPKQYGGKDNRPKGHDSLLQKLLNTKEGFFLICEDNALPDFSAGAPYHVSTQTQTACTLVAFDAFTITIEMVSGKEKVRALVFKHAIKSILLPQSFVTEARA